MKTFQLFGGTGAWSGFGAELLDDFSQFTVDVFFKLLGRHLEVVLLLESDHHATEVLTDKVLQEGVDGVAFWDVILGEELVGEIGTSFKGETLRQDESVVAVEKDVLDLE